MLLTATVLRVRPHREHDRLYTLYTKERGKLTVLGVGTVKITSKLAGHLGPFVISSLSTVSARAWEKLTGAEILECFGNIACSLPAFSAGWYLLELVDALTKENHPDEKLWELLCFSLRSLHQGAHPKNIACDFETRVLAILGERPPLLEHVGRELKSFRFFSAASPGMQRSPRRLTSASAGVAKVLLLG